MLLLMAPAVSDSVQIAQIMANTIDKVVIIVAATYLLSIWLGP